MALAETRKNDCFHLNVNLFLGLIPIIMSKIQKVISVSLQILKTNPPTLSILAVGTVSSLGWKNGRLISGFR